MRFAVKSKWIAISSIILIISSFPLSSSSSKQTETKLNITKFSAAYEDSSVLPNAQQRVQRTGNINMCQTNWGFWGSWGRMINESTGGCFNPHPDSEVSAPSFEFPKESGLDYLFYGGLWVGAKVNGSPYVSIGCDGRYWNFEFYSDGPAPLGRIVEASTIYESPCHSADALSDQDIISLYTDTLVLKWTYIEYGPGWNPVDERWHRPLHLRVLQRTFSWNAEAYGNLIIADYIITNFGSETLSDLYVGLFLDTDIWHYTEHPYGSYGPQDDITGFLKNYETSPGDTQEVNIAWAADNDGWGSYNDELQWTLRSIIGVKMLHISNPEIQFSYNWWDSRGGTLPYDWGPWKIENQIRWAQENCYAPEDSFFPGHALGTPDGDCSKYFLMSNGEIDYDQVYSCVWSSMHPEEGWLEPNELCDDFADGCDTRFLLSFGPFDQILPGDSIYFSAAYIIGENFHTDPDNGQNLPDNPDTFYAHLDFSDLVHKGLAAQTLYDSLFSAPTNVEESEHEPPKNFFLSQNYPNPFNPETRIKYTVGSRQIHPIPTTLKIYNILGQLVRTLMDEPQESGSYEVIWDGKDEKGNDVASGIYFYQLKSGEFSQTKKMVLIR